MKIDISKLKIKEEKIHMLQPTLRQKKRFFLIKVKSSKKFQFNEFSILYLNEVVKFLGIIDYANSNTWFIKDKFSYENQYFILKTSTKLINKLKVAIGLIDKVDTNINIDVELLKVSSTLKSLNEFFKK